MSAMVRKQVYIEAHQEERLKELAEKTGLKESELIRQGIEEVLTRGDTRAHRLAARRASAELAARIRALGPQDGPGRDWTRADLYDR